MTQSKSLYFETCVILNYEHNMNAMENVGKQRRIQ